MDHYNYISNTNDSNIMKVIINKKFTFLQRKNVKSFFTSATRIKRTSKNQINELFSWFSKEV